MMRTRGICRFPSSCFRRLYRKSKFIDNLCKQESKTMKYMLLIYSNPNTQMTEAEVQAEMNAYWGFEEEVRKAGVHLAGEGLHPISAATTVRVREGKTLTTDGPFA